MNTVDTLSLIQAARLLLDGPDSWTQGSSARDARGITVPPSSAQARCWCAGGALVSFLEIPRDCMLSTPDSVRLSDAISEVERSIFEGASLTRFNDAEGRRRKQVLAVLDRAIERLAREIG